MTHGFEGRIDNSHWLPFRNVDTETVPAFAVMKVSGTETLLTRTLLQCEQPDGSAGAIYVTNGPTSVTPQKFGSCNAGRSCVARYSGTTPGNGDQWGPANGQWELDTGGIGFTIFGTRTGGGLDLVEAVQISGMQTSVWGEMTNSATQTIPDASTHTIEFNAKSENGVNSDLALERFEFTVNGTYAWQLSFDMVATSGGSASWGIIATASLLFMSAPVQSIDLPGDNTTRQIVHVSFAKIEAFTTTDTLLFSLSKSGLAITADISAARATIFRFGP